MRELTVVEPNIAQDGLLEILAAPKAVALQDVLDPAIEAFDHAVGLGMHRRREAMLDAEYPRKGGQSRGCLSVRGGAGRTGDR